MIGKSHHKFKVPYDSSSTDMGGRWSEKINAYTMRPHYAQPCEFTKSGASVTVRLISLI